MKVFPVKRLQGELKVPGDKSISHRALIISSLACGKCNISGFLPSEDCLHTLNCLRQMGVKINIYSPTDVDVVGVGLHGFQEPNSPLEAGNSGTTARLLLGLLAGQNFFSILTGDDSLSKRPMGRVVKPLQKMGANIWGRQNDSMLPLAVRGNKLQGITYDLPVASAQLKSALLLAGLLADSPTTLTEPSNSRDHTERMLRYFGVQLKKDNHTITIVPEQVIKARNIIVPGDFSSAAFFVVGALITPDSELIIRNVGVNPTRTGLLHVLQQMGAKISLFNKRMICGEPVADIHIVHSKLKGATVEGQIVPTLIDEIPALVIAALHADGETIIRDATELRVKETDRIAALVSELNKIGGLITELPDGLIIHGSQQLAGGSCESWHVSCSNLDNIGILSYYF
jgi:3-phosphoshikimate 1-carboxyvinyltransferase